jgi:hypothetical protein
MKEGSSHFELTPEEFPWFYERDLLTRYLDYLFEGRFNAIFLWSGFVFPSLVELPEYPEARTLTCGFILPRTLQPGVWLAPHQTHASSPAGILARLRFNDRLSRSGSTCLARQKPSKRSPSARARICALRLRIFAGWMRFNPLDDLRFALGLMDRTLSCVGAVCNVAFR